MSCGKFKVSSNLSCVISWAANSRNAPNTKLKSGKGTVKPEREVCKQCGCVEWSDKQPLQKAGPPPPPAAPPPRPPPPSSPGRKSFFGSKKSKKKKKEKASEARSAAEKFIMNMQPEEEEEPKVETASYIMDYRTPIFSQRAVVASMTPPQVG